MVVTLYCTLRSCDSQYNYITVKHTTFFKGVMWQSKACDSFGGLLKEGQMTGSIEVMWQWRANVTVK